jgi:hypothetical protein
MMTLGITTSNVLPGVIYAECRVLLIVMIVSLCWMSLS